MPRKFKLNVPKKSVLRKQRTFTSHPQSLPVESLGSSKHSTTPDVLNVTFPSTVCLKGPVLTLKSLGQRLKVSGLLPPSMEKKLEPII